MFDGVSPDGTRGGYAVDSLKNNTILIPKTNAEASQVLASAGADGVQGYQLKVDYQLTPVGQKIMNQLRGK
jgi:adhesin/invasin